VPQDFEAIEYWAVIATIALKISLYLTKSDFD